MGRGTIILLGWEPGTVASLLLFSPVVERRSIEMGCNHHGPGQCYFVKRKTGPSGLAPSTPKTPARQPLVLAAEGGGSPRFRPCPSSSCSRPGLRRPQPPAGLPAPAHQASAAPAGLQALAGLPLQRRRPAHSLPQLQHGTGWAGGWGHAAELGAGAGKGGATRRNSPQSDQVLPKRSHQGVGVTPSHQQLLGPEGLLCAAVSLGLLCRDSR